MYSTSLSTLTQLKNIPTKKEKPTNTGSGMMDDFMVVTVTRPGPLYVRLRPDARGLVIVNNFDLVPDDPLTGCPRLGPVEGVGVVMPGDALVRLDECATHPPKSTRKPKGLVY